MSAGADATGRDWFVVLDDDATGSQVCQDVTVELSFAAGCAGPEAAECDTLAAEARAGTTTFVLTNSRRLDQVDAVALTRRVLRRIIAVATDRGLDVRLASRSDSTLRGHFPAETDCAADELARWGRPVDGILFVPAYPEAGRITVENVQLLRENGRWVPVADSEFARDPVFGYGRSDLRSWIARRTGQLPGQIEAVALEEVRVGGPALVSRLCSLRDRRVAVLNATVTADLDAIARAVRAAEREGSRFVYRCGPSFVRARAGIPAGRTLPSTPLAGPGRPGLVVVGSYTHVTAAQLDSACAVLDLSVVDVDVAAVAAGAAAEVGRATREAAAAIRDGRTSVVRARGAVRPGSYAHDAEAISTALVQIVRRLAAEVPLGFVVAKGGATSSDLATRALSATSATVVGQFFPGQVSLWRLDAGSAASGIPYVVFPGNVGAEGDLAAVLGRLGVPVVRPGVARP